MEERLIAYLAIHTNQEKYITDQETAYTNQEHLSTDTKLSFEKSGIMQKIDEPVIYELEDSKTGLDEFKSKMLKDSDESKKTLLLKYPTVYIHNYQNSGQYDVYIGETNDIIQRTEQHIENVANPDSWQQRVIGKKNAVLYVIGHDHFNKSLTLDVENRLMLYMSSVDCVRRLYNARGNEQNKYYPENEFNTIFDKIWTDLGKKNATLFPGKKQIEDSAIFKASPLHKLTNQQIEAKSKIVSLVEEALRKGTLGNLIFISGEAGTGKTVLNSNIFYDMCMLKDSATGQRKLKCHLLVNHDQQLKVYRQIAVKLGLFDKKDLNDAICKPTHFINSFEKKEPADILFVDEAHLLWTQGKQSYRGSDMLTDLLKMSRAVVIMFDENQMLHRQEYWDPQRINLLKNQAKRMHSYYKLTNQLRIRGNEKTRDWIYSFTKEFRIKPIPEDKEYQLKVFDSVLEMQEEIEKRAACKSTSLSRIIATFDWPYTEHKKNPEDENGLWEVSIGNWHLPWNLQIASKEKKRGGLMKELAWAEQPQTIGEVGSTYTIQGFDLNYAGVILGPSVKYQDGKIVFDPSKSCDKKATGRRTLTDGTKKSFGTLFIKNEVNVLMTRGVNGLFLYAVDPGLRAALLNAQKEKADDCL